MVDHQQQQKNNNLTHVNYYGLLDSTKVQKVICT